ncbi:MAG: hypothetical protein EON59_12315 [Alphaproteobacteria bacterium]|nr:MAG: hypothetical protein EON59_12315 [Alphaproteobacteria bacterium]
MQKTILAAALMALLGTTNVSASRFMEVHGLAEFSDLVEAYGEYATWAEVCGWPFQHALKAIKGELGGYTYITWAEAHEALDTAHHQAHGRIWMAVRAGEIATDEDGCNGAAYDAAFEYFRTIFFGWHKPSQRVMPLPPELPLYQRVASPDVEGDTHSQRGPWQSVAVGYGVMAAEYHFCGMDHEALAVQQQLLDQVSHLVYIDREAARHELDRGYIEDGLPMALVARREMPEGEWLQGNPKGCLIEAAERKRASVFDTLSRKLSVMEQIDYEVGLERNRAPMKFGN